VVDRPFEQPGDRGEVDVRMRAHGHALAAGEVGGAEFVDEDERADHGALPRGQGAADLELAEVVGDGGYGLGDRPFGHGACSSIMARKDSGYSASGHSSKSASANQRCSCIHACSSSVWRDVSMAASATGTRK